MQFIYTAPFERTAEGVLTDENIRAAEMAIIAKPDVGSHLGHNVYKLRVAAKGKGKSGGARVIYYWKAAKDRVYFMRTYAKSQQPTLTDAQWKQIVEALE